MSRNFRELLEAKWADNKFVCVGLDTDAAKLPQSLKSSNDSLSSRITAFNREIIEATKDIVLAYKPNIAFYEALGEQGWKALNWTIGWIHQLAPDVPVILDAKRGDIGNTNMGYVGMAFNELMADAITVHPYLGGPDALKPFLDQEDKGIIVLCRTSNPGAREFQDVEVHLKPEDFDEIYQGQPADNEHFTMDRNMPLWKYVAHRVHDVWDRQNHNCCVVVGATYREELAEVRKIVGDMPILIPGIGAQGGDVEKTVRAGMDSRGRGMIINSSRGIIFASSGTDFAEAARRETQKLHNQILEHLPKEVVK